MYVIATCLSAGRNSHKVDILKSRVQNNMVIYLVKFFNN